MAENATLPATGASEQTTDGFETFVTGETREALISYSQNGSTAATSGTVDVLSVPGFSHYVTISAHPSSMIGY
jgi:hypothetical protein